MAVKINRRSDNQTPKTNSKKKTLCIYELITPTRKSLTEGTLKELCVSYGTPC